MPLHTPSTCTLHKAVTPSAAVYEEHIAGGGFLDFKATDVQTCAAMLSFWDGLTSSKVSVVDHCDASPGFEYDAQPPIVFVFDWCTVLGLVR